VNNATRPEIFKWRQTKPELILCAVRWYLRYSLSLRDVEELFAERGLQADHTCAPQNYSGDGQGRRIVKAFASGKVRPEHRAIVPWLFYSSGRRCEVASSSTQSSSV
jgi:hypothetical protein